MKTLLGIFDGKVITFLNTYSNSFTRCGDIIDDQIYLCPSHFKKVEESGEIPLKSKWVFTLIKYAVDGKKIPTNPFNAICSDQTLYCKRDLNS
jgi:hypothetical protein